jgi:apolipoprotein N-acyltransferase
MFVETSRTLIEPPFGLTWMRLGINWHDVEWLNGSARVWGVWGLSYVVMAIGGGAAALARSWRSQAAPARTLRRWAVVGGGLPLLVAAALSAWTRAPDTEQGPRVLLVQPGFAQERKMEREQSALELFLESRELTARGIAEARRAGERPIDLVAWGETMLPIYLGDPALDEALRRGAAPAPWADFGGPIDPARLQEFAGIEKNLVLEALLAGTQPSDGVLPPGAAFLSGVIYVTAQGDTIGRQNAVVLWNADGSRGPPVSKSHRVPGAETMLGLERFAFVRDTIFALATYVPDLLPHVGPRTLQFSDRQGREYRFGVAVCFDNAFDGPFVEPLLEGPLDFNFVASNEAWFKNGQEPDQMMAFSRLAAIATGRSIVRATNSGISAVLGPDGAEIARLVVGGKDREVAGTLRADVPVPTAEERSGHTFYVRSWRWWPLLALVWPLLLLTAGFRLRRGYRAALGG